MDTQSKTVKAPMKIALASMGMAVAMGMSAHAADVVRIGTGDNYPPLTAKSLEGGGYAIVITEEALKESGYTVEVNWLKWAKALKDVEAGKLDVTFPWAWNAERDKILIYSKNHYIHNYTSAYVLAGQPTINSTEDIKGKTACIPNGYNQTGELQKGQDGGYLKVRTPKDLASCFKLLKRGKVDFVSSGPQEVNAATTADVGGVAGLAKSDFRLSQTKMHMVGSKSNPRAAEIINAFDAGFDKLNAAGKIDEIKSRY